MKVWLLCCEESSMVIESISNSSFHLDEFKGELIHDWSLPSFKVLKKGRSKDFAYLSGGIPIFSERSLEVLYELINDHVQLVDLDIVNYDTNLTLVNVINLINAVDYSRSIPELSPWGKLRGFHKYCLLEKEVTGQHIFKTPEFPTVEVFVSDQFRETVLNSKLKGFQFIEVWDSERTDELEREELKRYEAYVNNLEQNKGPEFGWSEAIEKVEQGKAVASKAWRMQKDENGTLQIARLELNCQYSWLKSEVIPPILLGLAWHEVEKLHT
ncbi:hypothetical protein M6D81_04100 [Paenibacillus sp. J5C_2022]|uniref:imm11 family protein n=1 Tax=Paenibacillus sp. J5C2022 TaxID=2977129 RepID=UPI0021D040D9|nr:DUF1629 domain-containing protein [Paenibacillus sp. J5C2022]MCU6707886.1 hypothetical protein [Paenibacillus sp. J5C2022]